MKSGRPFSSKGLVLSIIMISHCLTLFSQEKSMGMGTKVFNFSSFSESKRVSSSVMDKESSEKARKHPEYGILPFNAQCSECVELIDRRTMNSRLFIDPLHPGHTWSQQSYFPLHYMDINGLWRTIDHRLRPLPGQAGVFVAADQPMPVRFDLAHGYTSIDLHYFEFIYNKGLKMYFAEDTNALPLAEAAGNFNSYTVGDDGARVFGIWPGIDMEAFAKDGRIETNFIILKKPVIPVSKGYMVIEDHVSLPEGYTLGKTGELTGPNKDDLLIKNNKGTVVAMMEHVRIRNNANHGVLTEYVVQRHGNDYIIKMLIPYSFLNADASAYPVVLDPVVSGSVDTGNYASSHLALADLKFSTLPGHCDYHMTDTVPGMSTLLNAFVEIEDQTNSTDGLHCGDTAFGINGHICLKREIGHVLICDTCNATIRLSCYNSSNCDTPGLLTTDSVAVRGAGPIPLGLHPYISCLPPQCPDFYISWTLQNSDSSCEDNCGNLCAFGNMWRMTIEACQIDAYITATDTTVCTGQPTTLTCHASCGVPPYHYLWSNGMTGQSIVIYPPAVGIDIACTAYDTCNNAVTIPPDLLINTIPSPTSDAGPGGQVCEGGTIALGGSPTGAAGNTVTWSASGPQALSWISDTTASNPTVTVPHGTVDTTFYVAKVFDGTCFTLDTAYVYSLPDPAAMIDTNGTTSICNGQSVTLNANGPFSSYLWSNGSTSQSITVSAPGSYYVIVTDSSGCTDTSGAVVITTISVPNILVYPDTTIFFGDSVKLYTDISLSPPAVDSFFWQPNDSTMSCLTCPDPYVSPPSAEAYYLTVYTQGCKLTDSTFVSVILPDQFYIPDAFTPNGDGVNDYFYLYGQSGVIVNSFRVFDRWGEKVHDGPYPWDGRYRGQYCVPGIYVYEFTIGLFGHQDDVTRKGSITLIR